ncbi:type II secretion system minor pseudopilin GspI [Marinomonas sp. 15G1-11]|uniref:Type II secretion system protein I n=1 Tax=Marinomonas phaeophyticola TaxID=3004091 RepID=A0ABT4JT28_9GAMM|nr:type II secretion system minor pseudopilin GspI [Marinomonas sp. 15G1-11]MCZ2721539.1 type II secretion system minor pseudopilin GspI [Marinomonas sp. 15G1-11]
MPLYLPPNNVQPKTVCPHRHSITGRAELGAFTLIEVLIALVIIALVGMMLAQTSSQSVDQTDYLKRKLMAAWVAENRMTELRLLSLQGQEIRFTDSDVEQGQWRFRAVSTLENQAAGVLRIKVQVFQLPQADSPLFTLTGYIPANIRAVSDGDDVIGGNRGRTP